jgi:hypothetical protein
MHPQSAYYTALPGLPAAGDLPALAGRLYQQAFRGDFGAPGVALVSLGRSVASAELRQFMVTLKECLDEVHAQATDRRLVYLSLARFNQQVTTKYHLDGAPDEAFLMLGYEPSVVRSELCVADYTKAAHDMGIDPKTFLSDFNPMFAQHERRLAPYITRLEGFDHDQANLLLLNNSSLPYQPGSRNLLGVMHKATILNPLPDRTRTVNSTMIGTADRGAAEPVSPAAVQLFLETREIAGTIAGRTDY